MKKYPYITEILIVFWLHIEWLLSFCGKWHFPHAAFPGKSANFNHKLVHGKLSSQENCKNKSHFFYMKLLRRPSFTVNTTVLAWKLPECVLWGPPIIYSIIFRSSLWLCTVWVSPMHLISHSNICTWESWMEFQTIY